MVKFHSLKIKEIKKETPDSVSVVFDIPENLKDDFNYKPGQYLTFKVNVNGEELRRSYSLSSSTYNSEEPRVAIKKVENGRVSGFFNEKAKVGDAIEVMPPMGRFVIEINKENAKNYVGIAAGSGITPIISMAKSVLIAEPKSSFTLFYGNKNEEHTIFKSELDSLKNSYGDRFTLVYIYSRQDTGDDLTNGRIDTEKIKALVPKFVENPQNSNYYICGPFDIIEAAKNILPTLGVDSNNIHFELFGVPTPKKEEKKENSVSESQVTVIMDGDEFEFTLAKNGDNILDASIEAGVDAPFSCKGAVCCTCKAQVVEGAASMDMNYALSEEEVADGFILTCQAHPTTDKIVVDFDVI